MFKYGQKVICVIFNGNGPARECCKIIPIKGEIYTVRELRTTKFNGAIGLLLEEIVNPPYDYAQGFAEPSFDPRCFRPVDYTYGESVCEELDKITEPELV